MAQRMVCDSCGGEYDSAEAKCPYCGTLNIGAAEAEYMGKLEDVHEDLEALKSVPGEEVRRAVKSSGNYLKKLVKGVVVAGILLAVCIGGYRIWEKKHYSYDYREVYLWQEQNFPRMNQMYEEGKYEELSAFVQEVQEFRLTYGWEHYHFCDAYRTIREAEEILERDEQGSKLNVGIYENLLNLEWKVKWLEFSDKLSDEEKGILIPMSEALLEDLESRWNFTEEEYAGMYQEMTKEKGYVSYGIIDPFVEKWYTEYME